MEETSQQTQDSQTPSADDMLQRLHAVDTSIFDVKAAAEEAKGKRAWLFVLVMPLSAIFLVSFTLVGGFFSGSLMGGGISFLIAAFLLFVIGNMIDQHERQYRFQAREMVIDLIRQTEGEYGLIPHFKDFLPTKYRHLWQSLRKGNYLYIEQYIAAITLLQSKLEADNFTRIWHIRHPEVAPPEPEEEEIA